MTLPPGMGMEKLPLSDYSQSEILFRQGKKKLA